MSLSTHPSAHPHPPRHPFLLAAQEALEFGIDPADLSLGQAAAGAGDRGGDRARSGLPGSDLPRSAGVVNAGGDGTGGVDTISELPAVEMHDAHDAHDTAADRAAAQAAAEAEAAAKKAAAAAAAAAAARATAEAAHEAELSQARERQKSWQSQFLKQQEGAIDGAPPARTRGAPCGERHPEFRLGMVIPWVGQLPIWAPYFLASARGSAAIADFLVFHEGQSAGMPLDAPGNVIMHDLGTGGLSQLMGMALGEALDLPVRNASVVMKAMRFMFEKWPRLVAEYKPTFGSVFAHYLKAYTHWGYCDLDMVIGNLPVFLEREELQKHDIVSYTFGDQEAIYLRGQWTIHRNEARVSTVWKECPHLGEQLQKELLLKVAWVRRMESRGIQNYPKRFQSAEGCYSQKAVAKRELSLKMVHKQFVGLTVPADQVSTADWNARVPSPLRLPDPSRCSVPQKDSSLSSPQMIYYVDGSVWQCAKDARVDVSQLALHGARFKCDVELPGVLLPVGAMEKLDVSPEGCGRWMPVEYRMVRLASPTASLPHARARARPRPAERKPSTHVTHWCRRTASTPPTRARPRRRSASLSSSRLGRRPRARPRPTTRVAAFTAGACAQLPS